MTDEERDKKYNFVKNQAKFILSQGFDSVMIFASIYDGDETTNWAIGEGNWCARYGQVREWINRTERDILDNK